MEARFGGSSGDGSNAGKSALATTRLRAEDDDRSVLELAHDTILIPIQVLTSPSAKRAYISTVLLFFSSFLLYAIAVVSYIAFYRAYIPQIALSLPIHLQFDRAGNIFPPNGSAIVPTGALTSNQVYDVTVNVHMPRTRANLDTGNFMLDLALFGPPGKDADAVVGPAVYDYYAESNADMSSLLFTSRRPAILTYVPRSVTLVRRFLTLLLHVLGVMHESEQLSVTMFESVEFAKGWRNIPRAVRLTLLGRNVLQVYGAEVLFSARFTGLRWLMWQYKLTSFVVGSALFWGVEVFVAVTVWSVGMLLFSEGGQLQVVGGEKEAVAQTGDTAISDGTPIKQEEEDDAVHNEQPEMEADVEDEDEKDDFVADMMDSGARDDSGIGTSLESSGPGSSAAMDAIRRRRFKSEH